MAAGDRLPDRIGIGVLAKVFPPELVDRVVEQRLGWQVMQKLLEAVAGPLAGEEQQTACVAGMRLVAIDGMCLDVPATAGNGAEFGYPGNDAGPGPFPQVRVVGLGECGTRAVLGAELSPLSAGEQPLALKLLGRLLPGDLVLAGDPHPDQPRRRRRRDRPAADLLHRGPAGNPQPH